jgi:leucyl aminopeptidase
MNIKLHKGTDKSNENHVPIFILKDKSTENYENHSSYNKIKSISEFLNDKKSNAEFNFGADESLMVVNVFTQKKYILEEYRKAGYEVFQILKKYKLENPILVDSDLNKEEEYAFLEGLLLSTYSFDKYKSEKKEVKTIQLNLEKSNLDSSEIEELHQLVKVMKITKDMVNEPPAFYTPKSFSDEMLKNAQSTGIKVEVLEESQIQSLKMGGLLAVNRGSSAPPTFNILKWEPENAKNIKPIILVGKGVLFDTGGLSIKTMMMELMKSDMAGAAAVYGAILLAALNKLPYKIYCIIPVTDNRISSDDYAPGDVITMFNKKTVEVLNTDAEGRLILADALAYAEKFEPELVIDLATLTGAALRAVGNFGNVMMGSASKELKNKFIESGEFTYERMVEFPLWEEYSEQIISDVADIKNIGGAEGGAQTAAAFLQHFVKSDWMHLDIAPYSFLGAGQFYRSKGATATGLRTLYHFLKNY